VLEVKQDEFTARLTNLANAPDQYDTFGDLEATFSVHDLSRDDVPLLREGAIFYWNIGYFDDQSGQRHRVDEIRFRRLPAWSQSQLTSARSEAEQIRRELGISD